MQLCRIRSLSVAFSSFHNIPTKWLWCICCVFIAVVYVYHAHVARPAHYDEHLMVANFINAFAVPSTKESTCSSKATKRGPSQKIISVSFFHNPIGDRDYFAGIKRSIELMTKFYPGWVLRVYHDSTDLSMTRALYDIEWKHGNILDLCFVGNLPNYGNFIGRQNAWRLLTLADPLVNVTIFRDLDATFQPRELAAVHQWLESVYPMHVMRDHPTHTSAVTAGLWGAKLNAWTREQWRRLLDEILGLMLQKPATHNAGGPHMAPLDETVWQFALKQKDFVMQHDSYTCTNKALMAAGGMRPFPTCREPFDRPDSNFVGARFQIDSNVNSTCPELCRKKPLCSLC